MKKHTISISVASQHSGRQRVMTSRRMSIPQRIFNLLFGEMHQALVIVPGENVASVEIHELRQDEHEGRPEE